AAALEDDRRRTVRTRRQGRGRRRTETRRPWAVPCGSRPMSRTGSTFETLRERGERALVTFFTAGDPSLDATERLLVEADRRGADVIELGVPFSDPIGTPGSITSAPRRSASTSRRSVASSDGS